MFHIFADILMFDLIEDSWILISAFKLLQYVVLGEVYEENLPSFRYVVGKRSILIAFSNSWGYSLLLHHNSINGSFIML